MSRWVNADLCCEVLLVVKRPEKSHINSMHLLTSIKYISKSCKGHVLYMQRCENIQQRVFITSNLFKHMIKTLLSFFYTRNLTKFSVINVWRSGEGSNISILKLEIIHRVVTTTHRAEMLQELIILWNDNLLSPMCQQMKWWVNYKRHSFTNKSWTTATLST